MNIGNVMLFLVIGGLCVAVVVSAVHLEAQEGIRIGEQIHAVVDQIQINYVKSDAERKRILETLERGQRDLKKEIQKIAATRPS